MKELDNAIDTLTELKPLVDELEDIESRLKNAKADLAATNSQLENLRGQVQDQRNQQMRNAEDAKKKHDADVFYRQGVIRDLQEKQTQATAALTQVQNDHAAWSAKFEALARKHNLLEKSVA